VAGCSRLIERPAPAAPAAVAEPRPLPTNRFELSAPGSNVIGQLQVIRARQKDTFIDIAQAYHLGYDELVEANPKIDPWLPGEGTEIVLPTRFVLPDAPRQGLVLNIAAKRLFYFPAPRPGAAPVIYTYPISIGREGWATPLGTTRIVEKIRDPVWHVPASVRKEHAADGDPLPATVPPGPDNPLGRLAMRLAIGGDYLIHGTNKPAGIGMRMSHGCIRMNPDDIDWLFNQVPVGLPVRLVNQPVLIGTAADELLLEVHPPLEEDKTRRTDWMRRQIAAKAKRLAGAGPVDNARVARIASEQRGTPFSILAGGPDVEATLRAAPRVANIVTYEWFSKDDEKPQPALTPVTSRGAPK
jgi:L,D-transpeptidase ErfK/SrfK